VSSNLLIPKASVFIPFVTVVALLTTLASPILAAQRLEVSLFKAFKVFYAGGAPLCILMFVLFPVVGLVFYNYSEDQHLCCFNSLPLRAFEGLPRSRTCEGVAFDQRRNDRRKLAVSLKPSK
jgi:hypothetical protein